MRIADSLGRRFLFGFLLDFLDLGALVLEPDLVYREMRYELEQIASVLILLYLHYSQTQPCVLGQVLSDFAARLGGYLEGGLEGASLLRVEYGAWSFGAASSVQLGRKQLVAIEVCKREEERR